MDQNRFRPFAETLLNHQAMAHQQNSPAVFSGLRQVFEQYSQAGSVVACLVVEKRGELVMHDSLIRPLMRPLSRFNESVKMIGFDQGKSAQPLSCMPGRVG